MLESEDRADSKSAVPKGRVGSSPTSGTKKELTDFFGGFRRATQSVAQAFRPSFMDQI